MKILARKIIIALTITVLEAVFLSAQTSPRTSIQEVKINTFRNTTLINGFTAGSATYDTVDLPQDGRKNVIKVNGAATEWDVLSYSLDNYKGKTITVR